MLNLLPYLAVQFRGADDALRLQQYLVHLLHHLLIVIVQSWHDAEQKGAKTHHKLLLEGEDVIIDEVEEGALDFEARTLVEVVEVAGEEAHVLAEHGCLL